MNQFNQQQQSLLSLAYQQELQKQKQDQSYIPLSKKDIFHLGKCPGDYSLGPKFEDHTCELKMEMEVGEMNFSCQYCWNIQKGELDKC